MMRNASVEVTGDRTATGSCQCQSYHGFKYDVTMLKCQGHKQQFTNYKYRIHDNAIVYVPYHDRIKRREMRMTRCVTSDCMQ